MRVLRYLIPIVIFAALALFLYAGLFLSPGYVPSPLIGKPAPAFELPSLEEPNRTVSDRDLRGQPSVLNVWATWCVGCRQEHETLLRIAHTGEVPIYGLNWKDNSAAARTWLEELGNPYVATAVDAEGRVAIDWGVYGAPETFLIDANGTVLYKHIAPLTMAIWQEEFLPRIHAARETP